MKLNQDCVRDLLLYLEENLNYNNEVRLNQLNLKDYSREDLLYTAQKLIEADYINCVTSRHYTNNLPFILVKSITFKGHEFLDTIRDKTIWENTKSKASKFTSISLPIIQQLATSLIKSQLGL
ncbi:MAG: DUF2513 domain-containing protein [Clostridia bacterium]|nr:DUF2513 domain-containing protein [Clostridia bacterium]